MALQDDLRAQLIKQFAADVVEVTEENGNVKSEILEETLTANFVNNTVKLYADNTLLFFKEFKVAENDIVSISEKSTVTYDGNKTLELYLIDYYGYSGDNAEMEEAISPTGDGIAYFYVLCDDVEEYVEPSPSPDTTPTPTPDVPEEIICRCILREHHLCNL